jgi:phage/plasmid-like protein (TIGR03299 family)
MAHLVETMAFVGETPWHGLGHQLPSQQSIEIWAQKAGMAWDICETPVRYLTGTAGALGAIESFPDQKVLFRSDTHAPLSVVSQRYQVVQPRQILEFYRDLSDISGFELETAGVLKGGRKFWALARTGQSTALKGKDVSRGYVLLATACDGTLATTAQFTNIRVVCNNTLAIALGGGNAGAVKVPHSTRFDAEAVKKQLGISVAGWKDFMDRMKALSERKMKHTEVQRFFLQVFTDHTSQSSGVTNESAMAKALSLYEGRGRGAELASAKGTAYGLLNAVTEFVDHERRARSTDHRLDSAWFGQGAALKHKALDQALLLV